MLREKYAQATAEKLFVKVYGSPANLKTSDANALQEMFEWLYNGDISTLSLIWPNLDGLAQEWAEYVSYEADEAS